MTTKPIPYDEDNDSDDSDERDKREVTVYDEEALELMPGWTGGTSDPLYAISSTGGRNYAWVFEDAIVNLDRDLRSVKRLKGGRYQLGKGTFSKKEIDELRTIRDALQSALDESGLDETRETREGHRVADFNTLPELIKHAHTEGATHHSGSGAATKIYFPRGDGQYEEATVWKKEDYWHAQGPGARSVVKRVPGHATPITARTGRRAAETTTEESHKDAGPPYTIEQLNTLLGSRQHWSKNQYDSLEAATESAEKHAARSRSFAVFNILDRRGNVVATLKGTANTPGGAGMQEEAITEEPSRLSSELRWSHDGVANGRRGSYQLRKTRNGWTVIFNGHTTLGDWVSTDLAKNFAERFDRQALRETREEHSVRDYIAVDRDDRKVAGPFRSRGEAQQHVPIGGYVQFSSARNRKAPPAPSSYPVFREGKLFQVETKSPQGWQIHSRGLSHARAEKMVETLIQDGFEARIRPLRSSRRA